MNDPALPILYTQPRCTSCEAAKAWLEQHGVAVTTLDIRAEYQHLYDFMDTGSRTTPTLIYDGKMLEGFDPSVWADELGVAS